MEGRRLHPPFAAEPRLRMPISNPGREFMTDLPGSEPPPRKRVAVAVRHTSPRTKTLGANDALCLVHAVPEAQDSMYRR